jgi:hypothetical protein
MVATGGAAWSISDAASTKANKSELPILVRVLMGVLTAFLE